ncbi:hypothetical protein BLOT_008159 [Blomia tropicalis]|nr:hypothetical protein BLOT_008159 [Blomia tropicalis]
MQQIMDILKNEIIPFKGMNYVQRYFRNYYPTEMENWEMYYQSKQIKLYYCIGSIKAIHFAYLSTNHIYTFSFYLPRLESSGELVRFSNLGDAQCCAWKNNTFEH